MKTINTNTILQIVALLFLVIIGYMTFSSGSKWEVIKSELDRAREELKTSRDTLAVTKANLDTSLEEIHKLTLQKDIITLKRDSLLLEFERKNAKDWDDLQRIKKELQKIKDSLQRDIAVAGALFGKE